MSDEAKTAGKKTTKASKPRNDMLVSTFLKQIGFIEKYKVSALCFKYHGIIKTKKEWLNELKDEIKLN
jgi:hypothetical protein